MHREQDTTPKIQMAGMKTCVRSPEQNIVIAWQIIRKQNKPWQWKQQHQINNVESVMPDSWPDESVMTTRIGTTHAALEVYNQIYAIHVKIVRLQDFKNRTI